MVEPKSVLPRRDFLLTQGAVPLGGLAALQAYSEEAHAATADVDQGIEKLGCAISDKTFRINNVRCFGAKGNGITDDTRAIQHAINSLPGGTVLDGVLANVAGIVYLPSGIYRITAPLRIMSSGIRVVGAGRTTTTILNQTGSVAITMVGPGFGNYISYGSIEHLTIKGLTNADVGISMDSVSDWLFDDLIIWGPAARGIEIITQCITLEFRRVHITAIRGDGFHVGAASNALWFIDGKADLIAVDDAGIAVRVSSGSSFDAPTYWTNRPFWGERGTYFADVDGDGKADAIAVNNDGRVYVKRSNGASFGPARIWLTGAPNDREAKNYFYDVTGPDSDGKRRVDLIAINNNGLVVCKAKETGGFAACTNWTANEAFAGSQRTYFADVDGDGRVDAIAIQTIRTDRSVLGLVVRYSTGSSFRSADLQAFGFQADRGIHFARVANTTLDELVTVKEDGVWVLNGYTGEFYNATDGPFYGLR